ncbi:MAG: choice-of-anchor J domain-containing protein, partial [Lachnospiraceae bacterium]|nr:choice-of-anchor J domain-containing protein [Lachnospiraceae bacterium]
VSCEDHITTINRASLDGVNADFYVIETNVSGLGCIIPSQYYGEEGDYIDVTVIPAEGYVLKSITAVSGGEEIYLADEDGMYQLEMPAGNVTIYAVFSKRIAIFYEDFEHGGALPDGWTFLDRDGDGFNWEISSPDYPERIHSGDYLLASASYDNGKFEPLFPDNWAITPGIQIPYHAVLSFWTRGMDPTWASEKLGVYVGTEPTLDSMQPLIASIITTDEYENYTFDLDDYAGQTVYIAFRHYDVSDEFKVCLEDVGVFAYEEDVLDPVQMRYAKAALDGKLGLAFFVTLPDWLIQDQNAYVTFEQYGEVKTKMLSEVVAAGPGSDGSYRVCTYMPAAYYRENVTMRFYDGIGRRANIVGASSGSYLTDTGVVYTLERCVRSMKNSGDAKTKKLGIAMDDYCTATQIYFGHPTEGVTLTLSSAVNGVTESDLSGYKSVRKGTYPSKVKGVTLGASFESANTLKLGLTFEGNKKPTGVSYYVSEDGTLEHAKKLNVRGNQTSGYYIEMKNIPAASLGKTYTFFIKDKTNTFSIGCSVFTYVRATAFNTQMPKLLRNMTKALYLYGKAAEEYFAN